MGGGPAVFDVKKSRNVLVVRVREFSDAGKASDILMSVLAQDEQEVGGNLQIRSLMHFHRRLGRLHYNRRE